MNNFKNSFIWNTLGAGLNSVNSFLFLIVVTRVCGLEEAGIFSLCFSTANMFNIIAFYSGRTYQVADTTTNSTDRDYIINRLLNCFATIILSFAWCKLNNYTFYKSEILLLLIIFKVTEALSDVIYGIFQKNDRLDIAGKSMFIKSFLNITIFSCVLLLTKNLNKACLSLFLINIAIILIFDLRELKKYLDSKKIKKKRIFALYKYGFYTFSYTLIANYMFNIPRYAIDTYMNASDQAIYSVLIMPATIMMLLNAFILQPLVIKLKNEKENITEFKKIILNINIVNLVMGIIITIAYSTIGLKLLGFIYGVKLEMYVLLAIIIIIATTIYVSATILSNGLLILGTTKEQMFIYLISAIISYPITNILVINSGIQGGVFSYFVMMSFLFVGYVILFVYKTKGNKQW